MVYIYANKITTRLTYTLDFVFSQILQLPYTLTTNKQTFVLHTGIKINYSDEYIEECITLKPATELLFETHIKEFVPDHIYLNNRLVLFPIINSDFEFDVFAAIFYMISRYEEWQSFTEDKHQRFEASQSILFKLNSIDVPVVDYWILQLKQAILKKYPNTSIPSQQFKPLSTIDVDNVYWASGKGFKRTLGALAKDVLGLKLNQAHKRLSVVFGVTKDPFDYYQQQIELSIHTHIPLLYFVLCSKPSAYDRSLDNNTSSFSKFLMHLSKYADVAIHPSYYTRGNDLKLKQEIACLSKSIGEPITKSRNHFLRFNIKTTPKELIASGISEDYSMGFASYYGYRAGTCQPFFYFDLENNQITSLKLIPFAFMDSVCYDYLKLSALEAKQILSRFIKEAKQLNTNFTFVWHDRSFDELQYPGWKTLYEDIHKELLEKNS